MKRSSSRGQFARFALVAGLNTVATYLVYLALLQFVAYPFAYTVSYVLGIAMAYVANSKAVFGSKMSVKTAVRFPLVYLFQYAASMALMWLQIDVLGVPAWIAPWVVVVVMMPLSFLLTRRLLRPRDRTA